MMNILHLYHGDVKLKLLHQIDNFLTTIVCHHKVYSAICQNTENTLMIYFTVSIQAGPGTLSAGCSVWWIDEEARLPMTLRELLQLADAITFVENDSARIVRDRTEAVHQSCRIPP